MIGQFVAGEAQGRVQTRQRNGRGALDVVVERAGPVPVMMQQTEGVRVSEVFELNAGFREDFLHAGEELFDHLVEVVHDDAIEQALLTVLQ